MTDLSTSSLSTEERSHPDPVTYSIDEAAEILRINRKTVVAMIDRGELPSVRYARRRWVPARAIRQLLLLDLPLPTAARADRFRTAR